MKINDKLLFGLLFVFITDICRSRWSDSSDILVSLFNFYFLSRYSQIIKLIRGHQLYHTWSTQLQYMISTYSYNTWSVQLRDQFGFYIQVCITNSTQSSRRFSHGFSLHTRQAASKRRCFAESVSTIFMFTFQHIVLSTSSPSPHIWL